MTTPSEILFMCRASHNISLILAFAFALPTNVYAQWAFRASYSYNGNELALPNAENFFGNLTDLKIGTVEPALVEKEIFKAAFGNLGYATAKGNVYAEANLATLKAGFAMNLDAVNEETLFVSETAPRVTLSHARATARWADKATVSTPDVPLGVILQATGYIQLNGELLAFADSPNCCARAEASVTIKDLGGALITNRGSAVQTAPAQATDATILPADKIEVVIPFVTGLRRDIGYELEVLLEGSATRGHTFPLSEGVSSAKMLSNYRHTLTWGGITSMVVASTGAPVENWTIVSDSGFDYSRPYVPEPSSTVLLLGCAVGLFTRPRHLH